MTALHGFLGLPSDWDFLRKAGFTVETPPLGAIPESGDILLGYSMGGRLALHALLRGAKYRRAVIVSAGLGIEDRVAREERQRTDDRWARMFEKQPWTRVMHEWSAQPVFGGHVVKRKESDFDRRELARQLREWSPGVLPSLGWRLQEITIPVLWIAGERDAKYVAEGERAVSRLPNAESWICPDAGHRVPWEQPERFVKRLQSI
ncbi:MAG TPA: alpha/beta fold hydrolase [Thermoanaerobaculia bacterium]|nr:alpha/beta fold hydrolase [Thermoanaerobaculia bacterium]